VTAHGSPEAVDAAVFFGLDPDLALVDADPIAWSEGSPVRVRAVISGDGLYRVTTPYLCAGFVVERGMVTACAPILRRRLIHWLTVAESVCA
jgi:hypothetical protein